MYNRAQLYNLSKRITELIRDLGFTNVDETDLIIMNGTVWLPKWRAIVGPRSVIEAIGDV